MVSLCPCIFVGFYTWWGIDWKGNLGSIWSRDRASLKRDRAFTSFLHSLHFARGHWRFGRQRQICGWGYWIWLRKRYTTDPWNRHVRGAARPTPDSGTSTTGTGHQALESLASISLASSASLPAAPWSSSSAAAEEENQIQRSCRRRIRRRIESCRRMAASSPPPPPPATLAHPQMTVIILHIIYIISFLDYIMFNDHDRSS